MPTSEQAPQAIEPRDPAEATSLGARPSWRERASVELEKIVQLFSSKQLPDMCAKVLLTPLGERADITNVSIDYWQQLQEPVESGFAAEVLSGVPVVNGDFVMIDYMHQKLFFLVLEKEPSEGVSVVGRATKMEFVPWIRPKSSIVPEDSDRVWDRVPEGAEEEAVGPAQAAQRA